METIEGTPKVVQLPLIPPSDVYTPIAPYTLLFITRAYNEGEISFEEWLRLSREWAERMIADYGEA